MTTDFEQNFLLVLDRFLKNKKNEHIAQKLFDKVYEYNDCELLGTPWKILWQICAECNLRCKHCYFEGDENYYDKNKSLPTGRMLSLVDEISDDLSIVNLTITGGEPFFRDDIFQIIEKLKSKNIALYIQTNATLITDEKAKKLSKILNPKIDSIQISLDGANDDIYNSIRGKGIFQKTIEGINNLIKYNIPINVNCTVLSTNTDYLGQMYELCNNLGVQKLSLSGFTPMNNSQNYLIPDIKNLINNLAKVVELEKKYNKKIRLNFKTLKFFDFVQNEEFRKLTDKYLLENNIVRPQLCDTLNCHVHNNLYIDCEGNVYLCFLAGQKEYPLGNVKDSTLLDIWANRNDNIFFKSRLVEKMICNKCKYFKICKGGCMANAYNEYGDIHYPDKLCNYAKEQFNL